MFQLADYKEINPKIKRFIENFFSLISSEKLFPIEFKTDSIKINNDEIKLNSYKRIYFFGAGKSIFNLADSVKYSAPEKFYRFFITDKKISRSNIFFEGVHPLPQYQNLTYTKTVINQIMSAPENSLFVFLFSGGASSLFLYPAYEFKFSEYFRIFKILLELNLHISEMNYIRSLLSCVKSGKLLNYTYPHDTIGIYLTDVPSKYRLYTGSSPTYPLFSDENYSLDVLDIRYKLKRKLGYEFWKLLVHKEKEMKYDFPETYLKNVKNYHFDGYKALREKAEEIFPGKRIKIIDDDLDRDFEEIGELIVSEEEELNDYDAVIFAGEWKINALLTGKGGRLLHLALYCRNRLSSSTEALFLATDGKDGVTPIPAAGVFLAAGRLHAETDKHLESFTSYDFFKINDYLLLSSELPDSNWGNLIILTKNLKKLIKSSTLSE